MGIGAKAGGVPRSRKAGYSAAAGDNIAGATEETEGAPPPGFVQSVTFDRVGFV